MEREDEGGEGAAVGVVGEGNGAVVEFGGFFDEAEAEAGAFAAGELVLEGVEAFEEAREGVVWQAGAEIADGDGGGVLRGGEVDGDGGVWRGEIGGVFEEVQEGAVEQRGFAGDDGGRVGSEAEVDVFVGGVCGGFSDGGGEEIGEIDGFVLDEGLAAFDFAEAEELAEEAFGAVGFGLEIGQEAEAVGFGHAGFLEEFGGATNGGEGALQFVGEGLDIGGGVVAAFEFFAHGFDGGTEGADFHAAAEVGEWRAFAGADFEGVVGEAAEGAKNPEENGGAEEENAGGDECGGEDDFGLPTLEDFPLVEFGFANGEDADDVFAGADGGGDVEDGAFFDVLVGAGGACAVDAAKGEDDVAHIANGGAFERAVVGVVKDEAVFVGDVDVAADAFFDDLEDGGVEGAVEGFGEGGAKPFDVDVAVFEVGLGDGGEDVGVVDEDFFGGLEDFAGEVAQGLVDQQAEAADNDGGDEGEAEEGDAHFFLFSVLG